MWLFTGKSRTRVPADARRMSARCPSCRADTTFCEVEVTTSGGVWFVDLVSDKQRAWRCTSCGDTFDLRDTDDDAADAKAALPEPEPPRDLLKELEAERDAREAERQRRDVQVEDELAAIKRRLGK